MKKENAAQDHNVRTLPPPPSPRMPPLRVRASKKYQHLRKRELKTEKQARPTITRNSSSTLPTFKPRRTQMAPGYIGVSWPEKSRGGQEVCCRERRKQARMERALDRKRQSMMERSKIVRRSVFRRRAGTQYHGQKAVGKTMTGNEMGQADINHVRSLKRQIDSEKRHQLEFTRKMQQQQHTRSVNSLNRDTQSSTWHSKHVKECEELERQLKELRNRSRALFEAQGRDLSDGWTKKSLETRHEYTDGFRQSVVDIGKKPQEKMNRNLLNGWPEKEKDERSLERTDSSKGRFPSKTDKLGGESIHEVKHLHEPYLTNFREKGDRGHSNHSYQAHQALNGMEKDDRSDVVHRNMGGDKEVQEISNFVTQIGKEEVELEEKVGSMEKSLPARLDDTPQRFHELEQEMKEMHRFLDGIGKEKFDSAPLRSSINAQGMPKFTGVSRSTTGSNSTGVGRQLRTEVRDTTTRASDGIGFQSMTFQDGLTGLPGSRDMEKKVHTLGHEFSHLRAGEETTQGGILKNALPYPVNEQYYRRSLATGDTVAADVRSDRGRQAAPSSEIDWKSIRDISIYSDADASARKKELDARVLTSTLLLYATTPPDESLDPKHHSGGITEQKLDESSEERAAVAAFLSNTDGDGVTRVVQKVVKLYHLDGLQRVCLSRPTHNPKHRTRQVLFFKGDVSRSTLGKIIESGDPPKPIPLDPPFSQHMGIKLTTTAKCVEDDENTSLSSLQNSVRQCLLVFSDLGSISEMSSREGDSLSRVLDRVTASGFTSLAQEKKQDNGSSAWEYYILGSQVQSVVPV